MYRWALLFCVSFGAIAMAEDLRLADGSVYRDARVVQVRPDGLIVSHRNGVVLANYEKLPKATRAQYQFDPKKAAAYREREAAARQAVAEENRRLVAAYEERKVAAIQKRISGNGPEASSFAGFDQSTLTYQPGRPDPMEQSFQRGVKHAGEQIERYEIQRASEGLDFDTFWGSSLWKNPVVSFIGALLGASTGGNERGGGFSSEPRDWR